MQSTSIALSNRKSFFVAAAPLFLVLFIDSMGLGLVFPILNTLVFDQAAHFIAADMPTSTRNLLYGFTVGIYMLCWFFGAAFLGDFSDQVGRKKGLMICLLGAVGGYLISALAVIYSSYALLLTGRVIAGFTAGSQSIAQAAIVDISTPEHKARNLGLILFFTSLGFVFGPVVGGILSDNSLIPWFNFAMPFYFAASISMLNAILLGYLFNETFTRTGKLQLKLYHAVSIFISAFKHDKIRELSLILLVMIFGWSSFYSFISMYMFRVYQFTALQNGLFMGLMGIGFGFGTGFLIEPLTQRFTLKRCFILSCFMAVVGIALLITAPTELYVWLEVGIVCVFIAVAYSVILTMFSNQVDDNAQGWVMGITGAIMAFAFAVNGMLLGLLANLSPQTPMIISMATLLLSAILMKKIFKDE